VDEINISLKKYNILFAGFYGAGLAFINILYHVFTIDLGRSADMGVLIGCIAMIINSFYKDNDRLPTKRERSFLVLGNIFVSLLVSLAVVFLVIFISPDGEQIYQSIMGILNKLSLAIWITISLAVFGFYYMLLSVLYIIFGKIVRKQQNRN
jgi:hypothetical protein